jgi:hypothetical protein
MDKVQKHSNSVYYTPSSEPYGIYYDLCMLYDNSDDIPVWENVYFHDYLHDE